MKSKLVSPSLFNLVLILIIVVDSILPIKRIIYSPYTYIGILFILFGIIINIWSLITLRNMNTSYEFHSTPTRLATNGPYNLSRNPIYLSGIALTLGIAILLGSIIILIFLGLLFFILNNLYIPFEEKELERLFNSDYFKYKENVRRWI